MDNTLAVTLATAISAATLESRGTESLGGNTLLAAGHTYTQTRRVYCASCDSVLVADESLDASDVYPEDCECPRDSLTGARGFDGGAGELRGVALTGVRRANDASEATLRHAVALAERATEMNVAASIASFFGDSVESAKCLVDSDELRLMSDEIVAEMPLQTSNGADGANLDCEEMLDGSVAAYQRGDGRWAHERDAYLALEIPRRDKVERPLSDWERPSENKLGRIDDAKQAIEAAQRRNATFHNLRKDLLRSRSMERRCIGRGSYERAREWNQRAFRLVSGALSRYRDSVARSLASESPDWTHLYLTKVQSTALWNLNERRIRGIEALVRCFYFGK